MEGKGAARQSNAPRGTEPGRWVYPERQRSRWRNCSGFMERDVLALPSSNSRSGSVEEPFVILQADFTAGLRSKESPERFVQLVHPRVLGLIGGRHFVGAEEKSIGEAIDQIRGDPSRLRAGDYVFCD